MVRYDPTIYDGAAAHYRHGRPAYSPGLEPLLAADLGLDGRGRLLDVGCGFGDTTLAIARHWVPWPVVPLLSVGIGCCFALLTFVGHEALQGGMTANKRL